MEDKEISKRKIVTRFEDVEKISGELSKIKHVKAVYLFGSYATGRSHALSDIDLCVITDKVSHNIEREIAGHCSDNLDISVFYMLPVSIRFRVFKEGRQIIVNDEEFVNRLKFATLQEYLDFKPGINKFIFETLKCTI